MGSFAFFRGHARGAPNDVEDVLQELLSSSSRDGNYDESKSCHRRSGTSGLDSGGLTEASSRASKVAPTTVQAREVPFSIGITPDSNDSAGNSFADRIDMMMLDQSDRMRHYEDLGTRGEEILDCITDNPKGGNNWRWRLKSAMSRDEQWQRPLYLRRRSPGPC